MTERPPAPWAAAADRLARHATRRARTDAFARPAAIALVATGAALFAGKAARVLESTSGLVVAGLGLLAMIAVGRRAAKRIAPTTRGTAAWALDRLAGAHERGLTAALSGEDAARSPDGSPIPPPPRTRLRPADGTVLVLVAGLAALAGVLWQGPPTPKLGERSPTTASTPNRSRSGASRAVEAGRQDAEARIAQAQAASEVRIREALGLPPRAPLDEAGVADRLADPAVRAKALAAAEAGSPAAAALRNHDVGAAAALLRALESGAASEAERLRKEAASLRAGADAVPIPPSRRAVVARYLSHPTAHPTADPASRSATSIEPARPSIK